MFELLDSLYICVVSYYDESNLSPMDEIKFENLTMQLQTVAYLHICHILILLFEVIVGSPPLHKINM